MSKNQRKEKLLRALDKLVDHYLEACTACRAKKNITASGHIIVANGIYNEIQDLIGDL